MNSLARSTWLQRAWNLIDQFSFSKLLMILFSFSLLLHIGMVLLFIDEPIALDDMFQYDMLARSISQGNGYRWYTQADIETLRPYYSQFLDLNALTFPKLGLPTTFRAPGYPVFLALIYLLVPSSIHFAVVRLVQALLAAALAPMVAFLGLKIGLSKRSYFLSGIGMSLYPIMLFYPIGLISENLYIPLAGVTVITLYYSLSKHSFKWVALAGCVCGLTLLTRSIFAIFALLSGLWLWRHHRRHLKATAIFLLIAFGLCLPWSIRNSLLMKKPAFVENSLGYNLFIGYHPKSDGGFVSEVAILPMNILDDRQRDIYCFHQAIGFIRADPVEAARRIFVRLGKLVGPEVREFDYFYSNNLLGPLSLPCLFCIYLLLIIPWGITFLLGVFGLWQTRKSSLTQLVLLFFLGYGLPHLFIIAEPRFHLAILPLLIPFAFYGWTSARSICRHSSIRKGNWFGLVLLILAASVYLLGFAADLPIIMKILHTGGNVLHFSY
jgi:hypothetical protein